MLLTVLAYAMIIVFMYVVMTKKMSPFTSLVLVPLVFAAVLIITGSADLASDAKFVSFVGEEGSVNGLTAIGDMVL